jgi:1,4-alpha-glucan branching enzyme
VSVVGSFNQWTPDKHSLRECPQVSGRFERVMVLPPGRYEYKFVINGEWTADLRCPRWVVNEFQTLNSLLILRQSDASEPSPE